MRVGYGVLPKALVTPLIDLKANVDFGSPHLNQRLVSEVMKRDLYEPHVKTLCATYQRKQQAMLQALDTELGATGLARYLRPGGGLYVWVELLDGIDTGPRGKLFELAVQEGMLYVPGEYCFSELATAPRSFMRLSFGVQSEERIAEGVRRLARAIARAQ